MVTGAQLLGTPLIFGLLFYTYLQYRRKNISIQVLTLWSTIWILMTTIFIAPRQFYPLMTSLDIQRTSEFVLSVGLVLSLIGTFILHIRVSKLTNRMERLVENMAVRDET